MKPLAIAVLVAVFSVPAQPGLAWDPDAVDRAPDPPPVDGWTPERPAPAPAAPPEGLYLVTETYAGDSVTRDGPLTKYTTDTVNQITGSYARVLETVPTGASSAYDGAAFNGRAALTDGRSVAGTYYQDYVQTDRGFVPVSVVFFQDDSEIARAAAPATVPVVPPAAPPARSVAPAPVVGAPPDSAPQAVGAVTPIVDRADLAPTAALTAGPRPSAVLADRAIEVLRGRRVSISLGGPDMRAWRSLGGEAVVLGPLSGAPGTLFVARWDRLAPPTTAWIARFLVDYADGTSHELVVRVTVRAPGLVE